VRWAALVLAALALTGCETTAEKSARLERTAKQQQARSTGAGALARQGLSISRQSTRVRVLGAVLLHGPEGAVAVLALRNVSATSLRAVPVEIAVADARGRPVYANDVAGLSTTLVSAPLLRAHSTTIWIDDQIEATGTPVSVSARIGEGIPTGAAIPALSVERAHLAEDAASGSAVEGDLVNHSTVSQVELVVDALAWRGGRIVAAGRAVLPRAAGHGASTHFQLYLIGDARGARLELSASPTTLG
jgi:hypothetical protein